MTLKNYIFQVYFTIQLSTRNQQYPLCACTHTHTINTHTQAHTHTHKYTHTISPLSYPIKPVLFPSYFCLKLMREKQVLWWTLNGLVSLHTMLVVSKTNREIWKTRKLVGWKKRSWQNHLLLGCLMSQQHYISIVDFMRFTNNKCLGVFCLFVCLASLYFWGSFVCNLQWGVYVFCSIQQFWASWTSFNPPLACCIEAYSATFQTHKQQSRQLANIFT